MQDPSFAAGLAHNENLAELTMTIRPQARSEKCCQLAKMDLFVLYSYRVKGHNQKITS